MRNLTSKYTIQPPPPPLISTKSEEILKTICVVSVGDLQPEAVNNFCQFTPLIVGEVPEDNWEAELPILVIFSNHPERLQAHVLRHTPQMMHLHLTEDEDGCFSTTERPYISVSDWAAFQSTDVRQMTRPCENLHMWAPRSLRRGSIIIT